MTAVAEIETPVITHTRDGRPWPRLLRLSVAQMVCWAVFYYTFAVVQVPMRVELGWSPTLLAGAFSLTLLMYALAGPFLGPLFDRRGLWGAMVTGVVGGLLLMLAWSQVTHPMLYVVIMGALGLTMAACLYEPAFYLVARWFPERRAKALTLLTFFGALASPVFMPLTERLCTGFGWRTAILILAGLVAVVGLPLIASLPRGHAVMAPSTASGDQRARRVFHEARFWWLQIGFILVSIPAIAIPVHFVPFLVDRGETLGFSAACAGSIALAGIAGRLVFGALGDGRGLIILTVTVFALMSVAVGLLVAIPGKPGAMVFTITFGLGYGALWPTRAALVARAWSGPTLATIAGIFALGPNLAKAAAPLLAALIALWVGLDGAFTALAALPTLGALAIWRGRH